MLAAATEKRLCNIREPPAWHDVLNEQHKSKACTSMRASAPALMNLQRSARRPGSTTRSSSSCTLVTHLPGIHGELLMSRRSLRYRPPTCTAQRVTFTATCVTRGTGLTSARRELWMYQADARPQRVEADVLSQPLVVLRMKSRSQDPPARSRPPAPSGPARAAETSPPSCCAPA